MVAPGDVLGSLRPDGTSVPKESRSDEMELASFKKDDTVLGRGKFDFKAGE